MTKAQKYLILRTFIILDFVPENMGEVGSIKNSQVVGKLLHGQITEDELQKY